jgi:hypothetical protein
MGLAVEVGTLKDLTEHDPEGAAWIRGDLAAINLALEHRGLPVHAEPTGPELVTLTWEMPGYRGLAELRAVASGASGGEAPAYASYPHLMDHSDSEGYYLPIEFAGVLPAPPGLRLNSPVGSCPTLIAELDALAELLGLAPDQLGAPMTVMARSEFERLLGMSPRRWVRFVPGADRPLIDLENPAADAALKLRTAARYAVRTGGALIFH